MCTGRRTCGAARRSGRGFKSRGRYDRAPPWSSGGPREPWVPALSYSLIEPAKLAAVEPRAYLWEATLRAVRDPGAVTLARDLKSSKP